MERGGRSPTPAPIMLGVNRMSHRRSTLDRWSELAGQAQEIIRQQATSHDFHVADVAYALNVSVRQLQRALAEADTDFSRELIRARMGRGARELAQQAAVENAAYKSGFLSHSHFSLAFRRFFGVTPRQFRRAARLERHLEWRSWNDEVRPVDPGSSEYFKRAKRRRRDQAELRALIRKMLPSAQAALRANPPYKRPVIDLEALRAARAASRREARARAMEEAMERFQAWDPPDWDRDFHELLDA